MGIWNKRLADLTVGDYTKATVYSTVIMTALVVGFGAVADRFVRDEVALRQELDSFENQQ